MATHGLASDWEKGVSPGDALLTGLGRSRGGETGDRKRNAKLAVDEERRLLLWQRAWDPENKEERDANAIKASHIV